MEGMPVDELREWGDWTQLKLEILTKYLAEFTTASKRVDSRVFLDAFAGQGRGRSRTTGDVFEGSARIALNASDPGFTHLRYFERDPANARQLRQALASEYPGRDIEVFEGDCNDRIPEALAELTAVSWAPTFAFLDPDGIQLRWTTLRALAAHKQRSPYKTELWLLFSTMGLVRRLRPGRDQGAAPGRTGRERRVRRWVVAAHLRPAPR